MKVGKLLLIMMLLAAAPLMAQQAGFQTGIARGGAFGVAYPVTPPAQVIAVPIGPVANPGVPIPGYSQPIVVGGHPSMAPRAVISTGFPTFNPYFQPQQQAFIPGGQIIIPGSVIINGGAVFVQPSVIVQQPVIYQTPPVRAHFAGPLIVTRIPEIGASRDAVVRQLGQPTTVVTQRSGETLYFSNGTSVFFQNGKVAGPR